MGREPDNDWRAAYASALDWWQDAGVDTLVDEAPRDWLARPTPRAEAALATAPVAAAPAEILPATLDAFLAWRLGDAAPEAEWLSPRIAPAGPPGGLMVLTDMPEDGDTARLLSGPAGALFDRMLAAIGESRGTIHLASLAVARPLTGQIPAESASRLAALAQHHVSLAAPKRLLLLGDAPKRAFASTDGASTANGLGDINHFGGSLQVVASYSPRFLLGKPAAKAEAWKHLLLLTRGTSQ